MLVNTRRRLERTGVGILAEAKGSREREYTGIQSRIINICPSKHFPSIQEVSFTRIKDMKSLHKWGSTLAPSRS